MEEVITWFTASVKVVVSKIAPGCFGERVEPDHAWSGSFSLLLSFSNLPVTFRHF